jgi:hypothetical protein
VPLLLAGLALLVAFVHAVLYLRGDRKRTLRRCPKCRYDMAGVAGLTCPECGFAAPSDARFHFSRRKRRFAALALLWVLIAVGLILSGFARRGVVGMLPRPVLTFALEQFVPAPSVPAGADVPQVTPPGRIAGTFADPLWQRLAWNQQYVHAVRAWSDLVATDDPQAVLADLARVHRAVSEMDAWNTRFGSTAWVDSWVAMQEIERQRARVAALAPVTVQVAGVGPVTINRTELLMLAFQPTRNVAVGMGMQPGRYVAPPQAYLAIMAEYGQPGAQQYALERLGPEESGAVDIDALISRVEAATTDVRTRGAAQTVRLWRQSMLKILRANNASQAP